jgi:hypothetical protein
VQVALQPTALQSRVSVSSTRPSSRRCCGGHVIPGRWTDSPRESSRCSA